MVLYLIFINIIWAATDNTSWIIPDYKFISKPVLGHLFDYWRFIVLNIVQYKNLKEELSKITGIPFNENMDISNYPPNDNTSVSSANGSQSSKFSTKLTYVEPVMDFPLKSNDIVSSMKLLITYFVKHDILLTSPTKYYNEYECESIKNYI